MLLGLSAGWMHWKKGIHPLPQVPTPGSALGVSAECWSSQHSFQNQKWTQALGSTDQSRKHGVPLESWQPSPLGTKASAAHLLSPEHLGVRDLLSCLLPTEMGVEGLAREPVL